MNAPHEQTTVGRPGWPSTGWVALVGSSVFVSGFFLLAAAGRDFGAAVYALIVGGAVLITLPMLVLASVITASEAVVGRAWASGFHPLDEDGRRWRGIGTRAVRYAGFLWLANGAALWVATFTSRF